MSVDTHTPMPCAGSGRAGPCSTELCPGSLPSQVAIPGFFHSFHSCLCTLRAKALGRPAAGVSVGASARHGCRLHHGPSLRHRGTAAPTVRPRRVSTRCSPRAGPSMARRRPDGALVRAAPPPDGPPVPRPVCPLRNRLSPLSTESVVYAGFLFQRSPRFPQLWTFLWTRDLFYLRTAGREPVEPALLRASAQTKRRYFHGQVGRRAVENSFRAGYNGWTFRNRPANRLVLAARPHGRRSFPDVSRTA